MCDNRKSYALRSMSKITGNKRCNKHADITEQHLRSNRIKFLLLHVSSEHAQYPMSIMVDIRWFCTTVSIMAVVKQIYKGRYKVIP